MSIKLRVAGVFTLALAVAFALGSWLLISQLHASLLSSLDKTVTAQLAPLPLGAERDEREEDRRARQLAGADHQRDRQGPAVQLGGRAEATAQPWPGQAREVGRA